MHNKEEVLIEEGLCISAYIIHGKEKIAAAVITKVVSFIILIFLKLYASMEEIT